MGSDCLNQNQHVGTVQAIMKKREIIRDLFRDPKRYKFSSKNFFFFKIIEVSTN